MQVIDHERAGIEAQSAGGQRGAAVGAQRHGELRAGDTRLRRAQLAAHQRAELEFDRERAGTQGIVAARPDLDAGENERRGGQDAHIDRAADAHGQPDQAARLALEARTVIVPVNEKRPNQRRQQRQDERDRKTKQRRLHALSAQSPGKSARFRGRPWKPIKFRTISRSGPVWPATGGFTKPTCLRTRAVHIGAL